MALKAKDLATESTQQSGVAEQPFIPLTMVQLVDINVDLIQMQASISAMCLSAYYNGSFSQKL